jgi:hypothetical protein
MNTICDVAWFDERDIDVWLAEELRINEYFCRWFLRKLGTDEAALSLPAYRTRVSVMDDAGRETDVEALFRISDGETYAVLIEDKIKAGFQPNQMEDYLYRGERGKRDGKWKDFAVVTFAPQYRNFTIPPGVVKLTFDEASENLSAAVTSDPRLIYRAHFLRRASQPNVLVVETANPFVVEWWTAVDEMTKHEFGDFFIVDRRRFPKTTYVNLKCADMPSYLRLDLKGNQGEAALAFINFSEDILRSIVTIVGTNIGDVVRKRGQDPTLVIGNLQKFQISDGLNAINGPVFNAYQAAYHLLSFWKENRILFDEAAAKISLSKP